MHNATASFQSPTSTSPRHTFQVVHQLLSSFVLLRLASNCTDYCWQERSAAKHKTVTKSSKDHQGNEPAWKIKKSFLQLTSCQSTLLAIRSFTESKVYFATEAETKFHCPGQKIDVDGPNHSQGGLHVCSARQATTPMPIMKVMEANCFNLKLKTATPRWKMLATFGTRKVASTGGYRQTPSFVPIIAWQRRQGLQPFFLQTIPTNFIFPTPRDTANDCQSFFIFFYIFPCHSGECGALVNSYPFFRKCKQKATLSK